MLNLFGLCSLLLFCFIVNLFCSYNCLKIPIIPRPSIRWYGNFFNHLKEKDNMFNIPILPRPSTICRYGSYFTLDHLKEKAAKYKIPQEKILEFVFDATEEQKEKEMEMEMEKSNYNNQLDNMKAAAHQQISWISLR